MKKIIVSAYHKSFQKRFFDIAASLVGLLSFGPIIIAISLLIKKENGGPVFFIQKRIGKNGKEFKLIKFRTMKKDAEKLKSKYLHLNDADGPVFKITNDPRYTKFGRFLARTGLDELPQLINVLKGEMSLVGPRPLPIYEANKLTKSQKIRELVKPGITSSWVVQGAHKLSFKRWMELDKEYVRNATLAQDIKILLSTFKIPLGEIYSLFIS